MNITVFLHSPESVFFIDSNYISSSDGASKIYCNSDDKSNYLIQIEKKHETNQFGTEHNLQSMLNASNFLYNFLFFFSVEAPSAYYIL